VRSVTYVGFGDVRVLEPSDLVRYGVERKETYEFRKGVSQEVVNVVADALAQDSDFEVTGDGGDAPASEESVSNDDASNKDDAETVSDETVGE
jgi:hypothetical protein